MFLQQDLDSPLGNICFPSGRKGTHGVFYYSVLCSPVGEQTKESQEEEMRREDEFWHTPCAFTPESRVEAHRHLEEKRKANEQ